MKLLSTTFQTITENTTTQDTKLDVLFNEFEKGLHSSEPVNSIKLKSLVNALYVLKDLESYKVKMSSLRKLYPAISTSCTMIGRAFAKNYGYAGDFEIIDKIYTKHISEDPNYAKWDIFLQSLHSAKAVRNRKDFFIDKMTQLSNNKPQSVLNLASGPCRDILELFESNEDLQYSFDCVELDKNAIEYAQSLLGYFGGHVNFINKNIFRFMPEKKYDIIWSAGLFDYFDDKTFIRILKRLINSNPDAKIIIGNFCDTNPTRKLMEVLSEWNLHHRSRERLIEIAIAAGAKEDSIKVGVEPEGVNLFLEIN